MATICWLRPTRNGSPPTSSAWARCAMNGRSRDARRYLFQQLKPFSAGGILELREAGGVAAGPRHTFNEPGPHRVDHIDEHDGHCAGGVQRSGRRTAGRENDLRSER